MELSEKDRLTLALLYRVLEKVSDDGENYAAYYEALEGGYTLDYPAEESGFISVSEEHSREECQEVWDILRMFDSMAIVLEGLADKEGIDEDDFQFGGFDGNHDWQYSYQVYIVSTLERFGEIIEAPINSHGTVLPRYRQMLNAWNGLMEKYHHDLKQVTKEDLLGVKNVRG